jgi:hypothetical protein
MEKGDDHDRIRERRQSRRNRTASTASVSSVEAKSRKLLSRGDRGVIGQASFEDMDIISVSCLN